MLLDEFAALGRMPIIAEAISYLPGYNVRVVLVVQTPSQLRELYGPHVAETMLKSLAVRIVFAAKDHADAREISDELGFQTVKPRASPRRCSISRARNRVARAVKRRVSSAGRSFCRKRSRISGTRGDCLLRGIEADSLPKNPLLPGSALHRPLVSGTRRAGMGARGKR